jgi:hypothetical protein
VKLLEMSIVLETQTQLGYPETAAFGLGQLFLVCTILYAVPRTSFLGAILVTAYLRGAAATHVRVQSPLFTHVPFGVISACWSGAGCSCATTESVRWVCATDTRACGPVSSVLGHWSSHDKRISRR